MNENGTNATMRCYRERPWLQDGIASAAAKRFRAYEANNHVGVILYSGEDDSSGMDMTRDLAARMKLFENVCRGKEVQCLWK
jgi:hypothetical protein